MHSDILPQDPAKLGKTPIISDTDGLEEDDLPTCQNDKKKAIYPIPYSKQALEKIFFAILISKS